MVKGESNKSTERIERQEMQYRTDYRLLQHSTTSIGCFARANCLQQIVDNVASLDSTYLRVGMSNELGSWVTF